MGRVLNALETLDRGLQARPPHALLGTASLHASIIEGGRELSSYPDACTLKLERRTLPHETDTEVSRELETLLAELREADHEFDATWTPLFARSAYEVAADHELPQALARALGPRSDQNKSGFVGMSFWTDAAVLGGAGIPSVLFGPGGAGLHSTEEYVNVEDVLSCRETLVTLARAWTAR
jgi:acetylornithine deacetylase